MKNDKLRDYLLGGNVKLIGSIIGFSKGLKFNKWVKWNNNNSKIFKGEKNELNYLPEGYAILLYFYHRTGKIERHLYNPNLTFWGKKPLVNDYTQNKKESWRSYPVNPYMFNPNPNLLNNKSLMKTLQNETNWNIETDRPVIEIDNTEFKNHPELIDYGLNSFKYLFDGKLSRIIFNSFITELTRDYIINLNKNIEKLEAIDNKLTLKDSITDMKIIRRNDENQTIKMVILDYPSNDELKEIYVPKYLFTKQVNDFFY